MFINMDFHLTNNLEELEKLFTSRMGDYEKRLQKVTAGSSSTRHPDTSSLSREFGEFKSFVWQALSNIKTQIGLLGLGLDRHETIMRRKVLLFHGVSEKQNEKLPESVYKVIADRLKLSDVPMDSLHVCHRLGSAQGKTRPILVRFCGIEHKKAVWESKTSLKGTGITITEFLTQSRHRVFTAARKHFGVKHSWTMEGKIVVLLPDKTRKRIETMHELESLISQYPAAALSNDAAVSTIDPNSPMPKQGSKKHRRRQISED